ncbi:MAG: GNAT family N-acetyltransferase [Mycobacteriaceae bacterium]|nr:GNAT family N-acetyltransferase [Mycobacteriaceae bacterium]
MLGPQPIGPSRVRLRPPRIDDFAYWRRIRLRDRTLIEPFWVSSELDWSARHTEKRWVRECLERWTQARARRELAMVIEVDGRFAGQCTLAAIDADSGQAELGVWVDAKESHRGIGVLAVAMLLDFAFGQLGLARVTAPISPDNRRAARSAELLGLVREAVMAEYFDAGGRRADHELWAVVRADVPADGYVRTWLARWDSRTAAPESAEPAGAQPVSRVVVAHVALRYAAGTARRALAGLRGPHRVTLSDPAWPGLTVHSRLRESLLAWRGIRSRRGLVLTVSADGEFVGEARLFGLDMFDRNAQLHLRWGPTAPEPAATCATILVLHFAFDRLGLYRIAVAVPPDDQWSTLPAHAGLTFEGTMRAYRGPQGDREDHQLWAVTAPTRHP